MRTKACRMCGLPFESDHSDAYLCEKCRKESKRNNTFRMRTCIDCGTEFMGWPKSKRCPPCAHEATKARDRAHKKNGPKRKLGSTDQCQACGKDYIVESGRQRYCKDCAGTVVQENIRAHKREYQAGRKERNTELRQLNGTGDKVCVVCGKVFRPGTPSVTCSPECAKMKKSYDWAMVDYERGRRKTPPKRPIDILIEQDHPDDQGGNT